MIEVIAWILGAYLFIAAAVFAWLARTPIDSREAAVIALGWLWFTLLMAWGWVRHQWRVAVGR